MTTDLPNDRHTDGSDDRDLSAENGVSYESLPHSLMEGARNYIEDGLAPGKFLRAVLENDFVGATLKADHLNAPSLPSIARWLYNDIPEPAWGGKAAVNAWVLQGGLRGKALREAKWLRGEQ